MITHVYTDCLNCTGTGYVHDSDGVESNCDVCETSGYREIDIPHAGIWMLVLDHPKTDDCPDPECLICGMRDCPDHEPLHYHHDGCPCCSRKEVQQ